MNILFAHRKYLVTSSRQGTSFECHSILKLYDNYFKRNAKFEPIAVPNGEGEGEAERNVGKGNVQEITSKLEPPVVWLAGWLAFRFCETAIIFGTLSQIGERSSARTGAADVDTNSR